MNILRHFRGKKIYVFRNKFVVVNGIRYLIIRRSKKSPADTWVLAQTGVPLWKNLPTIERTQADIIKYWAEEKADIEVNNLNIRKSHLGLSNRQFPDSHLGFAT